MRGKNQRATKKSKIRYATGRARPQLSFMDAQHDLSEDMSFRQTLVGLGGFGERICFRNRHLKLRGLNGGIELLEFRMPATPS